MLVLRDMRNTQSTQFGDMFNRFDPIKYIFFYSVAMTSAVWSFDTLYNVRCIDVLQFVAGTPMEGSQLAQQ